MTTPRILLQFDTDPLPSVFDAVVASDAGVQQLLQYSNISEDNVVGLVHGAMFTRGPDQLKNTAIFVGGANVALGEQLVTRIVQTFFGPIRVSVMIDSNGANTTAAAAVLSAAKHLPLEKAKAVVLGGTGPVGQRVARLLLGQGSQVTLVSRSVERASTACLTLAQQVKSNALLQAASMDSSFCTECLAEAELLFACGAAGAVLMSGESLAKAANLRVAIDLNAVPPTGIEGINITDKAVARGSRIDYGAIGVGGLKMKIHRAAIAAMFEQNDLVLDAEQIFQVGQGLLKS